MPRVLNLGETFFILLYFMTPESMETTVLDHGGQTKHLLSFDANRRLHRFMDTLGRKS